eukprot:m.128861 g.128861  ORF g.128861 m.128861 type:complete len:89 (+) comp14743_c0_seq1:376-642(+)
MCFCTGSPIFHNPACIARGECICVSQARMANSMCTASSSRGFNERSRGGFAGQAWRALPEDARDDIKRAGFDAAISGAGALYGFFGSL